jgi:hypothetical protein
MQNVQFQKQSAAVDRTALKSLMEQKHADATNLKTAGGKYNMGRILTGLL